jgi:hypothetical protein
VQASQKRLDMVQAKARATAKAMVRKATASAIRDVLDSDSISTVTGEGTEPQQVRLCYTLVACCRCREAKRLNA